MDEFNLHLTGDIHAITAGGKWSKKCCLENNCQNFHVNCLFSKQPFGGSDWRKDVPWTGFNLSINKLRTISFNFLKQFHQTQPLEAFYGRLVPKVKGSRKFSPIQVIMSKHIVCHHALCDIIAISLFSTLIMNSNQNHVRSEGLSNLASRSEILIHSAQMKSGEFWLF